MEQTLPIVKPTETERLIWSRIEPKKSGGLIRQGIPDRPYDLPSCFYGPRDKMNPEHWDCKVKGGPDAEWWAYTMDGAHRVLDVGCGYGFPAFYLASLGHEVVGIDPSPSEIATAGKYRLEEGPDLKLGYQTFDPPALPFADASFDGATFSGSIATADDPEGLIREVMRVLKPGAKVAFDEEDRALEMKTHPVAEQMKLVQLETGLCLWVESRTFDPYLDRRYVIRLSDRFDPGVELVEQKAAGAVLPAATLEDARINLEDVLEAAVDAEYGEALGYDAFTLRAFVERMGFTELKFWARNNGREFAEELKRLGVLAQMPDDMNAVLRAVVRSIPPLTTPTTLISCVRP